MRKSLINARAAFGRSLLAATLGLAITFTPCDAANPSALVGKWALLKGAPKGMPNEIELLAGGIGIGDGKGGVTWKTEGNTFYFLTSNNRYNENVWDYKISGSSLILNNSDNYWQYEKCKNDCRETIIAIVKKAGAGAYKKGSFTDSRDGKSYKSVKVGDQNWMAENLNYAADGSKCYDNDENNCKKYGRLYNWETAKTACPKGWHLPSDEEWTRLTDYVGSDAGTKLKATSGWNGGNGTDDYGFSALPGGFGYSNGNFSSVDYNGNWWKFYEPANFKIK